MQRCGWATVTGLPEYLAYHDREWGVPVHDESLARRGFTFVGSTICYAFMQALGVVNDHLVTCFRHAEIG